MICKVNDGKLIVELDLLEPYPSSTGKNLIVATSGGGVGAGVLIAGKPVKINVTAWIPIGAVKPQV